MNAAVYPYILVGYIVAFIIIGTTADYLFRRRATQRKLKRARSASENSEKKETKDPMNNDWKTTCTRVNLNGDAFSGTDFNSALSELVTNFFGSADSSPPAPATPEVRQVETPEFIHLKISVPGCSLEDFEVLVQNRTLTVRTSEDFKPDFVQPFKQSWALNDNVSIERITASYKDGVLCVHVPYRKHNESVSRKIPIDRI